MAYLALFVALGGTAYAAAMITGADVVDESLTGADVRGKAGTATAPSVNGSLTTHDIAGQPANAGNGSPFIEGTLTTWDVRNETLRSGDVLDESLTNADLAPGSVRTGEIANRSITAAKLRPLWKVAEVIDNLGPLPREGTYTSNGGTLLITASGSGFRNGNFEGLIDMEILVDGSTRGFASVYANETFKHRTFVTGHAVVPGLSPGPHTIRLEEFDTFGCGTPDESTQSHCTGTDFNDRFNVAVIEIPSFPG